MAPAPTFAPGFGAIGEPPEDDISSLIAGLWQEAPFARLPPDAPDELQQYLVEIEDPRRVYTIHRAARRHGFQSMVDKYIYQLRDGCGDSDCKISTCFTCRKRLAGKSPIRRYSPLSARTLAVYLASQPHPERGLCPTLCPPKIASKSVVNHLVFETTSRDPVPTLKGKRSKSHGSAGSSETKSPSEAGRTQSSSPRRTSDIHSPRPSSRGLSKRNNSKSQPSDQDSKHCETSSRSYTYKISEQSYSKDHRSFAANLFGTVAFRMLEWLTPKGMTAISDNLDMDGDGPEKKILGDPGPSGPSSATPDSDTPADFDSPSKSSILNGEPPEKLAPPEQLNPSPHDPTKSRRSPETAFRSPQSAKPQKRASLELPSPTKVEEPRSPTKSPRVNSYHPDKLGRSLRSTATGLSRGIPDIPATPSFFGNVPAQHPSATATEESDTTARQERLNENTLIAPPMVAFHTPKPKKQAQPKMEDIDTGIADAPVECPLPQSLTKLNMNIVDFVCDVFEKDNTGEMPLEFESGFHETHPEPDQHERRLSRKTRVHDVISRRQWKTFNEQVLFDVLSNPNSLVASFTKSGRILDSSLLFYCMVRLTRTVPSLVFHSLWLAADGLFVPPDEIQKRGMKSTISRRTPLGDFDVGAILAICLHALAASAPICSDTKLLRALITVRSSGLTLSTFEDVLSQPSSLRERFDDAYSHELALRLARRLCCAVSARHLFALQNRTEEPVSNQEGNTINPSSHQPDFSGLETPFAIVNSPNSLLQHRTGVQILMIEWARAVIFDSWDGRPDFPTKGPLAGALSLMESMYNQRDVSDLIEKDFEMEYFSDRLDAMDVPIAWLSYQSTTKRRHLLDYPFLFSPDARVTLFRAVNFSRMSRMYEESSSLKTRMNAIVDRGSLITNPHHKQVLQDLLKTASSRYLVLEISRKNVLRDAFDQLWRREERELLRPMKVHLGEDGGEEGFDSGGVQQEFFRLAIAEFLDPHYGAFVVDDRTRMAWFSPGSVVELWKYELLGLLASLAVFNGLTLPVTFPHALYRKLLGEPVDELRHIADGWPDLASGLETLLNWDENDGAVEDIFARTYEFSVLTYGSHVTQNMRETSAWPQAERGSLGLGDSDFEAPLVTGENRQEYVSDYIRFLTDVSVKPQFEAFERGFRHCLKAKSLRLLTPKILQDLVEGVQEIDIAELRRNTRYIGWDSTHRTIKDFWSIVKRYDEAMKRRLMEFVTASDRLPVGGMNNLQFVVQKNGVEDEGGHLPTAYTCYGTLLLPEYRDKEVLRERLGMALDNAQGFGFA